MPEVFGGFMEDLVINNKDWTKWATCDNPQTEALPGEWEQKIPIFDKIIILKAFRPEKMSFSF